MSNLFDLTGKVALVTGASRGLGQQFSRALADAGADLAITSRTLASLAPFADELAVYPAHPLPPEAGAYALSFCIPMATPGLKFFCRDSTSVPGNRFEPTLA